MKYINEIQMVISGTVGILMRFMYQKTKNLKMSKLKILSYFVISYGMLFLLILFLRHKKALWGFELDDGTKMIFSAIGSIFAEKVFTFLVDREELIYKKYFNKFTGKNDGGV
jgi:hypothetical protein